LISDYAEKFNIILELNACEFNEGLFPIHVATVNKNVEGVKFVVDYADKHDIPLTLNKGKYLTTLESFERTELQEIILDYTFTHDIDLNLKFADVTLPVFYVSVTNYNNKVTKTLFDCAIKNNKILNINEKHLGGHTLLLKAMEEIYTEKIKIIIDYAIKENIIIDINETCGSGNYPFLVAFYNDIDIVKLIIDYANKNNITLKVNEQSVDKASPLILAIANDDIEMVKSVIDYAKEKDIILKLNEKDLEYVIANNQNIVVENINEIDKEIIELLIQNKNNNRINVEFDDSNELLKEFEELSL